MENLNNPLIVGVAIVTLAVLVIAIFSIKRALGARNAVRNHLLQLNQRLSKNRDQLFEFYPGALLLVNAEGRIVTANTQTEQMFGWSNQELVGQLVETLVPAEFASWIENLRASFTAAVGQQPIAPPTNPPDLEALRKDNTRFAVEISLKPIAYDSENLLVVSVLDISGQKKSHREITQAFTALDETDDAIFIYDADTLQFTYANKGAERQLGYSRNELLEMTAADIKSESSRESISENIQATLDAKGKTENYTDIHKTKHGKEFPVEIGNRYVEMPPHPFFVAVVRDISDRMQAMVALENSTFRLKQLNRKLELERENLELKVKGRTHQLEMERRNAEEANQAKSDYLATMSHEIRTPMNGVIGMIDLLFNSSLDSRQMEQVIAIKDSAYSLLTIIDDILDFSKIEAGELILEHEPVDLGKVPDSIIRSMQAIAGSKNVDLSSYRDPALPAVILSDAVRLRQIITNLVGNSIKFSSKEDGKGRVSLRFESMPKNQLRIRIEDNGVGIAAERLSSIFEPFKQAESSTSKQFGGTGLGLPITKLLVEKMGGTIEVESELGNGSTFTVFLPLEQVDGHETDTRPPALQGFICNLYCSNPNKGNDWQQLLSSTGAQVNRVENPEQLIEATAQQTDEPDSVFSLMIDDQLNVDHLRALTSSDPAATGTRLIALTPLAVGQTESVSEDLVLMDEHSNLNQALQRIVDTILGSAGTPEAVAHESAPVHNGPEQQAAREQQIDAGNAQPITSEQLPLLVAEDNKINQQVISNQLDSLGYQHEIADDGKAAFTLWRNKEYALVITDLHMPEMDGYELAKAIRGEESADSRIPILAYTANATKGERERVLEIGMDDYMTKPIQLPALNAKLSEWLEKAAATEPITTPSREPTTAPDPEPTTVPDHEPATALADKDNGSSGTRPATDAILEVSVLESLIGDDADVIAEFLEEYRKSLQQSSSDILEAYRSEDWKKIGDIAHSLKSSSRSVGAMMAGEQCAHLEIAGKSSDAESIRQSMPQFQQTITDVLQALAARLK